jgi:DNA-binding NarL/FixJ family response regulator
LKPLLERDSPELPPPWQAEADQRRCLEVWRSLTPRQRDVLRLLARGKTRQAAARELGIAVTTLDSHREAILRKCADCWEGVPRQEINLSLVRSQFASFLPMMEPV